MASCSHAVPIQTESAPQVWNHWQPKPQPTLCKFEQECRRLRLDTENKFQLLNSIALRFWVRHWYRRRYVPEFLIEAFVPEGQFETWD